MSDYELSPTQMEDADAILEHDRSEVPPPSDTGSENARWRKAMNRVLTGLALCSLTLNFLCLNYLLPAIGIVLLLLGFRTLRKENPWFFTCWIISILRAAYFFPSLIINTTIWQKTIYEMPPFSLLSYLNIAVGFILILGLWGAFRAMQQKAGLSPHAGGAVALMVWYVAICILGLLQYSGLFAILFIIAYGFIINSLFKLSKELSVAASVVQAAPVRLSDRVLVCGLLTVLVIGMVVGYVFFQQYPMEWAAVDTTEQKNLADTRKHLIELGFPEEILADLSADDLLACQGALRVIVEERQHALNDGREVVNQTSAGSYVQTVYDVQELTISGVAVELPGEIETWKLFHHFRWTVAPKFHGTDAIQLWPTYRDDYGWNKDGDFSGRVLYDQRGQTYASSYESLGDITYQKNSFFFGNQTSTDVFATFSFPKQAKNCRGYLSYTILQSVEGYITDSWINYIHQQSRLQYPVKTAMDYTMTSGMFSPDGAFIQVQDALQFDPADPNAKPFS